MSSRQYMPGGEGQFGRRYHDRNCSSGGHTDIADGDDDGIVYNSFCEVCITQVAGMVAFYRCVSRDRQTETE